MRTRFVVAALALALSACEDNGKNDNDNDATIDQDGGSDAVSGQDAVDATSEVGLPDASALTLSDRGCSDIFTQTSFPTFELQMEPAELAALQSEFRDWQQRQAVGLELQPFHPATVKVGNESVPDAAVRLTGPTWTWTGVKLPLFISFDRTNPTGRFHDLRAIELVAPPYDRTLMRSRAALAVLRAAGLPAQCSNNARVTINGGNAGVYVSTEPLDQSFVERAYADAATGTLWLYGWQPAYGTPAWNQILRYTNANDLTSLEQVCDLDETVKEWAWEAVLPHGNGFWGVGQSFALYEHPTLGFQFVPYDLNVSLDAVPAGADPIMWTGAWVIGPPDKLLTVLRDQTWRQRYVDAVKAAAAAYQPAVLRSWIDAWETQIGPAVNQDAEKGFSMSDHSTAVSTLRSYFVKRASFLTSWTQCMTAGGLDTDKDATPWCQDCNDHSAAIHPGAQEVCDNHIDDDCNGRIDDGCPGVDGGWVPPSGGSTGTDAGADAAQDL